MNEKLKSLRDIRQHLADSWQHFKAHFDNVASAEPTEVEEIKLQMSLLQTLMATMLPIAALVFVVDELIDDVEETIYHAAGEAALAAVA